MPYAAITYRVRPGYEEEISEIFGGFQRVDTPVFRDHNGDVAGRLLGTAAFIKDDVMVRIIHYDGDFDYIAAHMATQSGVRETEERLAPYLVEQRATSTSGEFQAYFQHATMRCVSQLSVDTHPTES